MKRKPVAPIKRAFACTNGTTNLLPMCFLPKMSVQYSWYVSYSAVLNVASKTGVFAQKQVNSPVIASLEVVDTQRWLGS